MPTHHFHSLEWSLIKRKKSLGSCNGHPVLSAYFPVCGMNSRPHNGSQVTFLKLDNQDYLDCVLLRSISGRRTSCF